MTLNASEPPLAEKGVGLVAPLFITNADIFSVLTLENPTGNNIRVIAKLLALEGQEVGRKSVELRPYSTVDINLDGIEMVKHLFPALGSISVSSITASSTLVRGRVKISSRKKMGGFSVEERVQTAGGETVQVGAVPKSFSVPVLAIRSLSTRPQHVFIDCEVGGQTFESEMTVGPEMTFLVNACINRKSESRRYDQILAGDIGATKGPMNIQIKAEDSAEGVAVWGFAATDTYVGSTLSLTSIEFSGWLPKAALPSQGF